MITHLLTYQDKMVTNLQLKLEILSDLKRRWNVDTDGGKGKGENK